MRDVRGDPDYLDDPVLQEYLQGLWSPLVAVARGSATSARTSTALSPSTRMVRARSVNAFALPGGHVGVHLGLVAMTERPEELASVLAHESCRT